MSILDRFLSKHGRHHSHSSYLTFVKGSIGMLLDPQHTESVFDIEDGLRRSAATTELLRFSTRDEDVKSMVAERYLREVPDTEALRKLAPGTLGREYVDHLDRFGYDPDYYRKIEVQDDIDYVMMRIHQTHDIWHVVTGFDTHPLGEIAVKAVELAQTHRPMAAAICAGGIFRYMIRKPEEFGHCLDSIVAGYHLGLYAKPLLAMRWEELWDRNVDDLRRGLDLVPLGPHGGELKVEIGFGERAFVEKAAKEEMAEVLEKIDPSDPELPEEEPHEHGAKPS